MIDFAAFKPLKDAFFALFWGDLFLFFTLRELIRARPGLSGKT